MHVISPTIGEQSRHTHDVVSKIRSTCSATGAKRAFQVRNLASRIEDVDSPLVAVRPVKKVLLVVITGDRGLCGGYNNFIIKKVS